MSGSKNYSSNINLDFDEWMNLARDNPDEFEAKRQEQIDLFFEKVPENRHSRLKGLQWQIDQTRKLSRSPMASCIKISTMMWESVDRLREQQYELVNTVTGKIERTTNKNKKSADIIDLRFS